MSTDLPITLDIDENFLKEEVRCDYTVSSFMKEVWAVELDLLNKLLEVCRKNNLDIYVSDGTLLGTVRHGGMIPWDDDIDVCMMRKDYDKLCKIADREFSSPYFFQTEDSDPGSLRGHGQFRNSSTTAILKNEIIPGFKFNQGIFIDVFPLDDVPENKAERDRFIAELKKIRLKAKKWANWTSRFDVRREELPHKNLRKITSCLARTFKIPNPYYKKLEKTKKRYSDTESAMVGDLGIIGLWKDYFHKREFFDEKLYMQCEMLSVPVPVKYKELLDGRYGNWQKFEYGGNMHGGILFDTRHSYLEYINGRRDLSQIE